MTDHKFTDEEVIKALECCKEHNYNFTECERCPYGGQCYTDNVNLCQDVLDLINRQKAEIEELEAECERQYEQAEADIRANIASSGTSCHWCMDKHRAEAVKEFADRLKTGLIEGGIYPVLVKNQIEKIVKEMTGENPYFTPADVRQMSPKEIRENYDAIFESMRKW